MCQYWTRKLKCYGLRIAWISKRPCKTSRIIRFPTPVFNLWRKKNRERIKLDQEIHQNVRWPRGDSSIFFVLSLTSVSYLEKLIKRVTQPLFSKTRLRSPVKYTLNVLINFRIKYLFKSDICIELRFCTGKYWIVSILPSISFLVFV